MRTLDEVIEIFERMAKSSREKARSIKPVESNIVFINDLFERAEEEEQIANWLKELKRLTITENKGDLISREALKEAMKIAHAKAIDYETVVDMYEKLVDNAPTINPYHEKINEIPKDFVYDTETPDFYCYRNKYTGKEIHIVKEPKSYILTRPHDKERSCENCKNYDIHTSDEMPCCKCSQLFNDYFEAKEDAK